MFSAVPPAVENEAIKDAVFETLGREQRTAAADTDNGTQHPSEHEIIYPSRLIYYLNEESESTYHDLDTRAKNQGTDGQVSGRLNCCWGSHSVWEPHSAAVTAQWLASLHFGMMPVREKPAVVSELDTSLWGWNCCYPGLHADLCPGTSSLLWVVLCIAQHTVPRCAEIGRWPVAGCHPPPPSPQQWPS